MLLFLFVSLPCFAQKGVNLINNGGFDKGYTHFRSELQINDSIVGPGYYSITNRAGDLNKTFIPLVGRTSDDDLYLAVDPQGQLGESIWCTEVEVLHQAEYEFSIWMASLSADGINPSLIGWEMGKKNVGQVQTIYSTNWVQYKWRWVSEDISGPISMCLKSNLPTTKGNDVAIDAITFKMIKRNLVCPPEGDTLQLTPHFSYGDTTLWPYSQRRLDSVVIMMKEYSGMTLQLNGHTDWLGKSKYNDGLSAQRARVVFRYLVSKGINPDRLSIQSFGEEKLQYKGYGIKKNVRNRRVEIVVGECK